MGCVKGKCLHFSSNYLMELNQDFESTNATMYFNVTFKIVNSAVLPIRNSSHLSIRLLCHLGITMTTDQNNKN